MTRLITATNLLLATLLLLPALASAEPYVRIYKRSDGCLPSPYSMWLHNIELSIFMAARVSINRDDSANYNPSHPLVRETVSCIFMLDDKGNIKTLSILKTSGSKDTDTKALELVRKAAPFKTSIFHDPILVAKFDQKLGVFVYPFYPSALPNKDEKRQ